MNPNPQPPKTYQQFVKRYPQLEKAWEQINAAGREGPLDEKTASVAVFTWVRDLFEK